MTTEKAFEQLKLAALEVKAALIEIDENIQPSVSEVESLSQKVNILNDQLVIYKFLKTQKELSPNLNIHLKVMEQVEQKVPVQNDEIKIHETISSVVSATEAVTSARKVEIGLNDKFRMINELFNNNSTEFNLAMEQLNHIDNLSQSETYLRELMNLYNWKADHELTIRIFQLNQKRFI